MARVVAFAGVAGLIVIVLYGAVGPLPQSLVALRVVAVGLVLLGVCLGSRAR